MQKNDMHIGRVTTEQPTLNDVFLEITGKALRDKEE
jgi:ABC-2 type transport system ATP-binding protein